MILCGKGLVPRRRIVETKLREVSYSPGPTTNFEALNTKEKKKKKILHLS